MKNALLLCSALLTLGAPAALAGGVNVTWTDASGGCWSDGVQVASRSFACNTNAGSVTMCGSFVCSVGHPDFVGIEVVVDGRTSDGSALPDWWQLFNSGACRQAALSSSADFTSAPGLGCTDPWLGQAQGGVAAWQTNLFPPPPPANVPTIDWMRLKIAYTTALLRPSPLLAGVEYYGFYATVNYTKTVGAGACAGCTTPVYFALNWIKVAESTGVVEFATVALPGGNQCLNFNTSGYPCWVPTRSTTWGQVKAMYR